MMWNADSFHGQNFFKNEVKNHEYFRQDFSDIQ